MSSITKLFFFLNYRCKDVLRTCPSWSPPMKEHTTTHFPSPPPRWPPPPQPPLPCYCPAHPPPKPPPPHQPGSTFTSLTITQSQGHFTCPTLQSHLHLHTQQSLLTSLQPHPLPRTTTSIIKSSTLISSQPQGTILPQISTLVLWNQTLFLCLGIAMGLNPTTRTIKLVLHLVFQDNPKKTFTSLSCKRVS